MCFRRMVQWLVLVVFFGGSMCVTPASGEDSKEVEDVEEVEETDHEEEFVYELEAITVTGSRIKSEEDLTPAPVIVMSRDEIKVRGLASIGDVLQTLTVQSNAINTQANNGGDGSTRISLRGLGAHRTLVLLNGRRFVPGGTGPIHPSISTPFPPPPLNASKCLRTVRRPCMVRTRWEALSISLQGLRLRSLNSKSTGASRARATARRWISV